MTQDENGNNQNTLSSGRNFSGSCNMEQQPSDDASPTPMVDNKDNEIDMTDSTPKSSSNSGGQIFSNASNFNVTGSQFNDIAGDSTTNTYNNNGGGNQVVNQNAGLHFGNTNVGHGQHNGGGHYSFGGSIPHHGGGSVQYGNRNTGNRQRNEGGVYTFGSSK